jgi:hypothetical protein
MASPAGRPIAGFRRSFPAVTTTVTVVALAVAIARAPAVASPSAATVRARAGAHATRNRKPDKLGKPGKLGNLRESGRSSRPPVDDQVAGKVAFFHFRGQDLADLEAPVSKALRAHGLTVLTELRPVDLPDQFRELAATLDLIAYVDGTVTPMRDERIRVALAVRSGYSGRKVARLSVVATPEDFPAKLDELFWKRFGPALVRARADAEKPRRRTRAPMQIDASSPMESGPTRRAVPTATTIKGPPG